MNLITRVLLLLTLFLCCSHQLVFAQNQHFISGSVGYVPDTEIDETSTELFRFNEVVSIEPIYGLVLDEKLSVGIMPIIRFSKEVFRSVSVLDTTAAPIFIKQDLFEYGISPFIRLKKSVSERFDLYAQVQLRSVQSRRNHNKFASSHTVEFFVSPGFEYELSPKWFISSQASIASYLAVFYIFIDANSQRLALGMNGNSISIRINYRFGKDKSKKRVE